MFVNRRILAGLAVAACMTVTPSLGEDQTLTGVWSGNMRQIDVKDEKSYPMTVTLSGATGASEYPTLSCGGRWTRIGESLGHVIYSETITHGRFDEKLGTGCIDGIVIVQRSGTSLTLGWYITFAGHPTAATAVLNVITRK